MNDVLAGDLIYVFVFFLGGLGFAMVPFILVYLLSPTRTRQTADKTGQYIECGMDPIGDAWIRYSASIIFTPWCSWPLRSTCCSSFRWRWSTTTGILVRNFVELVIFVGILSLVIVYAWKKGVFTWSRR
jgi:NADH:ubiquinone oxidoreductase subunit 3 (subunit A)